MVALLSLFLLASMPALGSVCEVLSRQVKTPADEAAPVLDFLSQFESAHAPVAELKSQLKEEAIEILPVQAAHPGQTRLDDPASLFDFVDGKPTIFIDGGELGVVAPLFLHETIHALDSVYASAYTTWRPESLRLADAFDTLVRGTVAWHDWQKEVVKVERRRHRMVFLAERAAFDGQQGLIEEIVARYPCAKPYYADRGKARELVTERVGDEALIRLYRLKRVWALEKSSSR